MKGTMNLRYHVWRVCESDPRLLGAVHAQDYMEARRLAEEKFGRAVEVYLPPRPARRPDAETMANAPGT